MLKSIITGKTNKFLQGPLTNISDLHEFDANIATGLPTRGKILNYRKSGIAFMNEIAVIPVYDWLYSKEGGVNSFANVHLEEMSPSHFIALLRKTRNRHDIPRLTEEEIKNRDNFVP